MRYPIKLKQTDEGYAVWCPCLPRCWSQGETEVEALENIKDAIESYLEYLEELNSDGELRYVEIVEDRVVSPLSPRSNLTNQNSNK